MNNTYDKEEGDTYTHMDAGKRGDGSQVFLDYMTWR